jgi:arginase
LGYASLTQSTKLHRNKHYNAVAALLGRADKKLATMYPGSDFIKPENLILIGVRNYENKEYDLLRQAAVEIVSPARLMGLPRC